MKERPILFSAPMVRALLAGTKTQTRRLLKTQLPEDCSIEVGPYHPTFIRRGEEEPGPERFGVYTMDGAWSAPCPYGAPCDRLWARETWGYDWYDDGQSRAWKRFVYRADIGAQQLDNGDPAPWRPSIHMPRAASRITLEITGVRVERLQSISEADAIAEGIEPGNFGGWMERPANGPCIDHADPRRAYRALWESIHGAGSWDANPFVWIIEFKTAA